MQISSEPRAASRQRQRSERLLITAKGYVSNSKHPQDGRQVSRETLELTGVHAAPGGRRRRIGWPCLPAPPTRGMRPVVNPSAPARRNRTKNLKFGSRRNFKFLSLLLIRAVDLSKCLPCLWPRPSISGTSCHEPWNHINNSMNLAKNFSQKMPFLTVRPRVCHFRTEIQFCKITAPATGLQRSEIDAS